MPWPCGRRCIPGLSFEGARFTLIWPNWAVSSMRFWLSWGVHEQKGSPCVESPRGYCMKLCKWSLDCIWSPKMLEVPEFWDIYQEELHGGASPRDRSVSDATKLEGQSHVGPLTSDMEPQDLEYGMLTFCFALVKHFLTIPLFIPSKSVMYILGYSMLKYVMCFLILQGLRLRDCLESQ